MVKRRSPMHIIHISSELAQVAKVGGLGDVVYGLSKAQIKAGHTVEIILPKYDIIQLGHLQDLKTSQSFSVAEGARKIKNTIWTAKHDELSLTLIVDHRPHPYFSRGTI